MWNTSEGIRTLEGAEARLFREVLGCLVDECRMSEEYQDDYPLGIEAFDALSYGQKLAMLEIVGHGLLVKSVEPPELTAVSEGAVGAVYQHLRGCVQFELDTADCDFWRPLIRAALLDIQKNEPFESQIPPAKCRDFDKWDFWIDLLEERIVWDYDWDGDMVGMDRSPEQITQLKQMLDIPEDYYVAVAPDPTPEEIPTLLGQLSQLTRQRCDGEADEPLREGE
jgi:hypothetical protein